MKFAASQKIPVELIVGEKVIPYQMTGYFLANSEWLLGKMRNTLTVRCLRPGERYPVLKRSADPNICMSISEPPPELAHFIPSYQIQTFQFEPISPRSGLFSAIVYTGDINFQLDCDPDKHEMIILRHLISIATTAIDDGIKWMDLSHRLGSKPSQCSAMVVIYFDQGHLGFDRIKTRLLMAMALSGLAEARARLETRFGVGVEIKFVPGHQKCSCGTGQLAPICLPVNSGKRTYRQSWMR